VLGTKTDPMNDEEFQTFLDESMDALLEKQAALKAEFGLSNFSRWHFDQATEQLHFFNKMDQLSLVAYVIDIGSFASNSNTWKWAWANDTVLPSLREKAEPLKELGTLTGFDMFTSESAVAIENENMAWELTAMGVRHLNAIGAYRAPSSTKPLATFLAITRVELIPPSVAVGA
jgi:hypothetical protein